MRLERRILITAIKIGNELIPIWDDRITYEKSEMYGHSIKIKGDYRTHTDMVECVYDLKTKKIEMGIELDYYSETEFKKDQLVLFEKSHRKLSEATIKEIVYEEFTTSIYKGKKVKSDWGKIFKDEKINDNVLYVIKTWKPFYILDNGVKIEWCHQLYHKI